MEDPKNTPPAGTPPAGNQEDKNKGGTGDPKDTPKSFSQEDVDKAVESRLAREREKSEKALEERLRKEREDWDRQTKLSQEEKDKESRLKQEKEIADRELKITLRENKAAALEKFAESKLPTKLVDLVVDANPELQSEKIENFTKSWNEALQSAVEERLKGDAPPAPKTPGSNDGKPEAVVPQNWS